MLSIEGMCRLVIERLNVFVTCTRVVACEGIPFCIRPSILKLGHHQLIDPIDLNPSSRGFPFKILRWAKAKRTKEDK